MGHVLLHIGYPKTGSTFLQQRWFPHHPQLRYVPGSIAGFHAVSDLVHYALDENESADIRYYVMSCEHFALPFVEERGSGSYDIDQIIRKMMFDVRFKAGQAHIAKILHELFPDSRVLIVTRGFAGILPSIYSQYALVGGRLSPHEYFDIYLNLLPDLLDYSYLIAHYEVLFGRENLIILPYELLREDSKRFVTVLEDRLQLRHQEIADERVNPSLDTHTLYWYARLSRIVAAMTHRLGPKVHARLYRSYVANLMTGRFRSAPRLLGLFFHRPDAKDEFAFIPDNLYRFQGRASILQDDPLYAPYADAYLLDRNQ